MAVEERQARHDSGTRDGPVEGRYWHPPPSWPPRVFFVLVVVPDLAMTAAPAPSASPPAPPPTVTATATTVHVPREQRPLQLQFQEVETFKIRPTQRFREAR
jgi:hypothetical protein